MGYSLSWLAIKGKSPQAVCDELGFHRTGTRQDCAGDDLCAAELRSDWYLIVAEGCERVAPDSVLERLTSDCEAVTCFVEEHVMVSHATGWKNGQKIWSVIHDAQVALEHLEAEGELPAGYSQIRDRLLSKKEKERGGKADCDYIFDIPVETGKSITGCRYDQTIGQTIEVLVRHEKPSFWKRLFGI